MSCYSGPWCKNSKWPVSCCGVPDLWLVTTCHVTTNSACDWSVTCPCNIRRVDGRPYGCTIHILCCIVTTYQTCLTLEQHKKSNHLEIFWWWIWEKIICKEWVIDNEAIFWHCGLNVKLRLICWTVLRQMDTLAVVNVKKNSRINRIWQYFIIDVMLGILIPRIEIERIDKISN